MRIMKKAKEAVIHRPRSVWVLVGAILVAVAWLTLRAAPTAQGAGDSHEGHGHDQQAGAAASHDHHTHHDHPDAGEGPTDQFTVWTEQFEILAEYPLPVVGEPAKFIVHVTDRQTSLPITKGPAKFVLRHAGTVRSTHVEPAPARPGIYTPELTFPLPAEWVLTMGIPHSGGEYIVELPPIHVHPSAAEHHEHEPEPIRFGPEDVERYGIEIGTAQAGCVRRALTLTGEIRLNRDRLAEIVPRMTGIASEIRKNLGDPVRRGEVLAVIESRSLADAKADYLAALERKELAAAVYAREKRLHQQEISSEQEYLDARQALTECNLLLRAARQKLLAMGFTAEYLEGLPAAPDEELTRLEITAPFDGTVIEKEITLGERVSDETPVFVVADLSTVWLDLHAHERDVAGVRRGQQIALVPRAGTPAAEGTIDYTHPIVEKTTRTVLVRAVLDNAAGKLRPGTFVTARVATDELTSCVTIDREAVQYLNDEPVVFVYAADEFQPRPVTLGKYDDRYVEAVSGVRPGEALATKGSFRLKAEIEKRAVGVTGHGHVH